MPAAEYPSSITELQNTCALRFDGYAYEQACGLAVIGETGKGLWTLALPIIDTLQLHPNQADNFAAFFILQRAIFKFGNGRAAAPLKETRAFDYLFLHLYHLDPPPNYLLPDHDLRWRRELLPRAEPAAAFVRNALLKNKKGAIAPPAT